MSPTKKTATYSAYDLSRKEVLTITGVNPITKFYKGGHIVKMDVTARKYKSQCNHVIIIVPDDLQALMITYTEQEFALLKLDTAHEMISIIADLIQS